MEKLNKFTAFQNNPDFFDIVISSIEKELFNLKKVVNSVNQMRVELAYKEFDLMAIIDVQTWENITEFIGVAPFKKEN